MSRERVCLASSRAGVRVWSGVIVALLLSASCHADQQEQSTGSAAPYRIEDGKVDQSTFLGWRVFHSTCHGCHGVAATGTTVAPDLTQRMKDMSLEQFINTLLIRYRIVLGADQAAADDNTATREAFMDLVRKHEQGRLIMPAWEDDPNVKPHLLDLYAYLKARADGALGPGRPSRIGERESGSD